MKRIASVLLPVGLWLAGLLLAPTGFAGNSLVFEIIDSERGLLQNSVHTLLQDSRGFIWIGTQGGVQRYDGYRLVDVYAQQTSGPALSSRFVTALQEDHRGRLWIGTHTGGVSLYDIIHGKPLPVPAKLTALQGGRAAIRALAADQDALWLATDDGLLRYQFDGDELVHVAPHSTIGASRGLTYQSLLPDGSGGVLLGLVGQGLFHCDRQGQLSRLVADGLDANVRALWRGHDGQVWIGSDQGLARLDLKTRVITPLQSNAPQAALLKGGVRAVVGDNRDTLWISLLNNGLLRYRISSDQMQHFSRQHNDPYSLPDLNLYSLLVDRSGLLWVGSSTQGLGRTYAGNDRFELYRDYSQTDGDISLRNHIRSMWQDPAGTLWLGLDGAGLKSMASGGSEYRYHTDALMRALPASARQRVFRIQAIAPADQGRLVLGSSEGLLRYDPASGKTERLADWPLSGALPNVRSLWRDPDGTLWFGSEFAGLFEMPRWPQLGRHFHDQAAPGQRLSSNVVLALHRDRHDALWVGTLNGLNRIGADGQAQIFLRDPADAGSLCNNTIRHFRESRTGELWIATHGGLCRVRQPAAAKPIFETIQLQEGSADPTVYAVLEDGKGLLWLSSNRGLERYDPSNGQRVSYDRHDGLQGAEFNGGSALVGRDGRLYFGGTRGFNAFFPDRIQLDQRAVPLHITAIQTGRQTPSDLIGELPGPIQLDYEDRVLAVQYAALDYIAPHRLQYRYRLQGFDADWVEAGNHREALYTNLDSGRYTLEILASNHDGVWGSEPLQVPIDVVPPLWWSNWAKLGYVIASLLALTVWGWNRRQREQQRQAAERLLRDSEARLKWALWGSGDALWDWDLRTGTIVRSGIDRLLGYPPNQVKPSEHWRDRLVHPDDGQLLPAALQRHLDGESESFEAEYRMQSADGSWVWIHDRGRVVERDAIGKPLRMAGTMKDITDRKRYEDELRQLANYDTLTGLPNRTLFHERLRHALSHARRHNQRVALLFLDLDRFKQINDSLGHSAGDSLLKQVARRVAGSVREDDSVSRLGGDEFTVILEGVANPESIGVVAEKVLKAFAEPFILSGTEVVVSPSIGISVFPDDGDDSATLLKNADLAMYHAKDQGRNNYQFFVGAMNDTMRRRLALETALRRGLDHGEFSLHYQPKMDIRTGALTGMEALLRWHSADLGKIMPDEFIPLAEDTGLIVPIGDWVLREACRQLVQWQQQGLPVVPIAVNISIRQLMAGDLALRVQQILQDFQLEPRWLQLEITESLVMANAAQAIGRLNALRQLGLRLAVDDFGTGYSSLSYLKRLPIDTIKIDKAFVRDITLDPDDATITRTIIAMAHSLKLNVVAEGVETNEQLQFLREEGCEEMQGYWLSRPVSADACADILRRHW